MKPIHLRLFKLIYQPTKVDEAPMLALLYHEGETHTYPEWVRMLEVERHRQRRRRASDVDQIEVVMPSDRPLSVRPSYKRA